MTALNPSLSGPGGQSPALTMGMSRAECPLSIQQHSGARLCSTAHGTPRQKCHWGDHKVTALLGRSWPRRSPQSPLWAVVLTPQLCEPNLTGHPAATKQGF